MSALDTAQRLEEFEGRGAGSDAERRAAAWLARELSTAGGEATVETFWCRPNWALAHAWHAGLALAGSLLAVASPRVGGGLLLAALASILCDAFFGISVGRRLTPERASQNVVAGPPRPGPSTGHVRLVLTTNYDAVRTGLVFQAGLRRLVARVRRLLGAATLGWLGWFTLAIVWLEVVAILRVEGHHGEAISLLQLPPTIGIVLLLAGLLELSTSAWSPSAGDNGSGVGVALALARALQAASPRHLDVEVVLAGSGDRDGIGLRRHLRTHRGDYRPAATVVLGVAACPEGRVRWWESDGALIPLRYTSRLRRLAAEVAGQEDYLGAKPNHGRGQAPAFPARIARIPSIAIGCLDADGLVPRSHQPTDRSAAITRRSAEDAVQFGLMLVDTIDVEVARRFNVDEVPGSVRG